MEKFTARELDIILGGLRLYRESIGHHMPDAIIAIERKVAELQRDAAYQDANKAWPLPL